MKMHDVNDDATLYIIYTVMVLYMMMTALGWWLEYTVKTKIDVLTGIQYIYVVFKQWYDVDNDDV